MSTPRSMGSHQSARMKNDEWLTPLNILGVLGSFDLDPCAPIVRPWATAAQHFTIKDNGLEKQWHGRVWLNPPFGNEWPKWVEKLADHRNGIALLAARTETEAFFRLVWNRADSICFLRSRPHFCYVNGVPAKANSGVPICLIAYGKTNSGILLRCKLGKTLLIQP